VSAAGGLSGGDTAPRLASTVLAGVFLLPAAALLLARIVTGFRVEPTPRGVMLVGGIWLAAALIAALFHTRRLLPWDLALASVCIGIAIPAFAPTVWLLLAAAASAGMLFVSAVVGGARSRAKGASRSAPGERRGLRRCSCDGVDGRRRFCGRGSEPRIGPIPRGVA
jgi:hypothetical protein